MPARLEFPEPGTSSEWAVSFSCGALGARGNGTCRPLSRITRLESWRTENTEMTKTSRSLGLALAAVSSLGLGCPPPPVNRQPLRETTDVFWGSAPAQPGEIVMLYGHNLAMASAKLALLTESSRGAPPAREPIDLELNPLSSLQASKTSLKFTLPKELPKGVYAIQLDDSRPLYILNRPQIYWAQGDEGQRFWLGGSLRVFGRSLTCADAGSAVYLDGAVATTLPTQGDSFSLAAQIPAELPIGSYRVFVHNGCGGQTGWSDPVEIAIATPRDEPTPTLSAGDVGAVGDGIADDTPAIERLLQKLSSLGGGTAYLPPGVYRVIRGITLPANVLLRGDDRNTTSMRWDVDPAIRLDAAIRGSHDFAIADLSLEFPVSRVRNGIISGMPWRPSTVFDSTLDLEVLGDSAGHVSLRRLLIDWKVDVNSICRDVSDDCRLGEGYGASGFLLLLGGANIRVEDSELHAAEIVANMVGADDLVFARNNCTIGERGWAFNLAGGHRVIIEDSHFAGTNDTRSGISFWSIEPNTNVYMANNVVEGITFGDCEGFTTDGAQGRYFGKIASATADSFTLPSGSSWSAPQDRIASTTCYILGGLGQGQYRHIVSGSCTEDANHALSCTAKLERPWNVVPDATSQIGINHTVDRLLLIGNTVRNASNIQIYGSGYESTLVGNELIDSGGLFDYANRYPGSSSSILDTQPQFFMQWLRNRVTGGKATACVKHANEQQGMRVIAGDSGDRAWQWTMIHGFVMRGNIAENQVGIVVDAQQTAAAPLIRDLVVENNSLSKNDKGVVIVGKVAGAVVAGNTYSQITTPLVVSDCVEVVVDETVSIGRPAPTDVVVFGPAGIITDSNPTYSWSGDSCDVVFYQLYVDRLSGPDAAAGSGRTVYRQDVTRAEAGCVSGGTCNLRPLSDASALAAGYYAVWVRAVNDLGTSAWASVSYQKFTIE
jgi:hypothetical protein